MLKIFEFPEDRMLQGTFIRRINRFLCIVRVGDRVEHVHVHDPGKIPLLVGGKNVILLRVDSTNRKTMFDLLAFMHNGEWIFSHSGYHSKIFEQILRMKLFDIYGSIRKEIIIDDSRIDFAVNSTLIEVKGCTWIKDDVGLFPDSPTLRGRKHIKVLAKYVSRGGRAYVVFLVFSKRARYVTIAKDVDRNLYEEVVNAAKTGVNFVGFRLMFSDGAVYYLGRIPFRI